jgi:predicted transcriptional regulator
MEDKAARFTILIDADKKKAFDELCAQQDVTTSQMIRHLIKDYLERHGVEVPAAPRARKKSGKPVRK